MPGTADRKSDADDRILTYKCSMSVGGAGCASLASSFAFKEEDGDADELAAAPAEPLATHWCRRGVLQRVSVVPAPVLPTSALSDGPSGISS